MALAKNCYREMFNKRNSLATVPALPATTLAMDCYRGMFEGCTSLATAPALPATALAESCYGDMFNGCTSLKISDQKTKEFPYKWRLPIAGDIDGLPENWNNQTLTETGWPFTSDPQANTTYYVAQPPIATAI